MAQPEAFEASLPLIRALEDLHVDYLVGGSLARALGDAGLSSDESVE